MLSLTLVMKAAAVAALCMSPSPPGAAPEGEQMKMAEQKQLTDFLTSKQWPELFRGAEAWSRRPLADRARLAGLLSPALADRRHVGLRDTQDLIIWYRIDTGDLKFQGHGRVVRQDLFVAGGRAAWALSRLMDVDLPELNAGLTQEEWDRRAALIADQVKKFRAAATRPARKPD